LPERAQRTDEKPQNDRDQIGRAHQLQRRRNPFYDQPTHLGAASERIAKVAAEHVAGPTQVLDMQRIVQPPGFLDPLDILGGDIRVEGVERGWSARRQVHHRETEQRYPYEQRHHLQQPPHQELRNHPFVTLALRRRSRCGHPKGIV
jgi:hypothetical protein